MRAFAITCVTALLLAASAAHAAKLTGKLTTSKEFVAALAAADKTDASGGRNFYWNEPNGVLPIMPPPIDFVRDFAVVLTRENAPPASKPEEQLVVEVHAASFDKNVIVVQPGSTVRFKNVDPYDHELFAVSQPTFPAELQVSGAFRPIEFTQPGIYEIHCRLIPSFKAWVIATPDPWIADVKADGTFVIDGLDAGRYTLRVFFGGAWLHTQIFEIQGSKTAEVTVQLPAPKPGAAKSSVSARPSKTRDRDQGEGKKDGEKKANHK